MDEQRKPRRSGPRRPHRVVIAGGGVAGLEALLAIHALMGEAAQVTLLDQRETFALEARSVEQLVDHSAMRRYELARICADHGAALHPARLARVIGRTSSVIASDGDELAYDSLVVAVGARRRPAYAEALTFRGMRDVGRMREVVEALADDGDLRRLAFVAPPGVTWPAPLYELALIVVQRAVALGRDDVRLDLVTPEHAPLEVFGRPVSDAVARRLAAAGVELRPATEVARVADGVLVDAAGRALLRAQRVIALPVLSGRRILGLPRDEHGFVPSDRFCRVSGRRGVYAVGDGSSHPVKQGGLASQQADVAARHIATRAGVGDRAQPYDPRLRAKLLTGGAAMYVRGAAPDGTAVTAEHALWWPATKVAASRLAAYLERVDVGERGPAPEPTAPVVHALGDPAGGVELLGSWEAATDAAGDPR